MSGFPTVNFSDTEEGLFTPTEILHLMRVEYERARRYEYPAALMMIAVDRLEYLHDLYGWESKEEILQGVITALRGTTRDSDFLGCMQDDHLMVVFPHSSEDTITAIATRLLRVCREIDFQSDSEATGIWAIEDTVIHETFGVTIRGSAFYEDRYVKEMDGEWRIAHTGYKRTYEEMFPRSSIEGLRLTAHRFKTDGQSEIDP